MPFPFHSVAVQPPAYPLWLLLSPDHAARLRVSLRVSQGAPAGVARSFSAPGQRRPRRCRRPVSWPHKGGTAEATGLGRRVRDAAPCPGEMPDRRVAFPPDAA